MRLYVGNMEYINSYCKVVHSGVYCNCAEVKALEYNNDFCDFVPDMSAADIRATAKGADDDSPYWFAAGIVE